VDTRRLVSIVVVSIAAVVIGGAIGDRISGLSEAPWWQWLPWALLVVFWGGMGFHLWNRRRRRRIG
jgi:hypothetical protein